MPQEIIKITNGISRLSGSPLNTIYNIGNAYQDPYDKIVSYREGSFPTLDYVPENKPWVKFGGRWFDLNLHNDSAQFRNRLYLSKVDEIDTEDSSLYQVLEDDVDTVETDLNVKKLFPLVTLLNQTDFGGGMTIYSRMSPVSSGKRSWASDDEDIIGITQNRAVDYIIIPLDRFGQAGPWTYTTYFNGMDTTGATNISGTDVYTQPVSISLLDVLSGGNGYYDRALVYRTVEYDIDATDELRPRATGGYYLEGIATDYLYVSEAYWPFSITEEDSPIGDRLGPVLERGRNHWHNTFDPLHGGNISGKALHMDSGVMIIGNVHIPTKTASTSLRIFDGSDAPNTGGIEVASQLEYVLEDNSVVYGPLLNHGVAEKLVLPWQGENAVQIYIVPSIALVGANSDTNEIAISGDFTDQFDSDSIGKQIEITGSTGNDGTYTIVSVDYDGGSTQTQIVVLESISSSIGDGSLKFHAKWERLVPDPDGRYVTKYVENELYSFVSTEDGTAGNFEDGRGLGPETVTYKFREKSVAYLSEQNAPWEIKLDGFSIPDNSEILAITAARLEEIEQIRGYSFYVFSEDSIYAANRNGSDVFLDKVESNFGIATGIDAQPLYTLVRGGVVFYGSDKNLYYLTGRNLTDLTFVVDDLFTEVTDITFHIKDNHVHVVTDTGVWVYDFNREMWIGQREINQSISGSQTQYNFSDTLTSSSVSTDAIGSSISISGDSVVFKKDEFSAFYPQEPYLTLRANVYVDRAAPISSTDLIAQIENIQSGVNPYSSLTAINVTPSNIESLKGSAGASDVIVLGPGTYAPITFPANTTVYAPLPVTFSAYEDVSYTSVRTGVYKFSVSSVLTINSRPNFDPDKIIPYILRINGEMAVPWDPTVLFETDTSVKAYYFDDTTDEIYFSCFNETLDTVETSYETDYIIEFQNGGTLDGVIIEGMSGNAKKGAIDLNDSSAAVTIKNTLFKNNGEIGLVVGGDGHILENIVSIYNGHSGIDGEGATNITATNLYTAYNNTRGLNPKWHGNKWSNSSDVVITNYYGLHNDIPGFWLDITNSDFTVTNLHVADNLFVNEMYELDSNVVEVNGGFNLYQRQYEGTGAAIQVQATKDVELNNRIVQEAEGNSITVKFSDTRGPTDGYFRFDDIDIENSGGLDVYVEGTSDATEIYFNIRSDEVSNFNATASPFVTRTPLESAVPAISSLAGLDATYNEALSYHSRTSDGGGSATNSFSVIGGEILFQSVTVNDGDTVRMEIDSFPDGAPSSDTTITIRLSGIEVGASTSANIRRIIYDKDWFDLMAGFADFQVTRLDESGDNLDSLLETQEYDSVVFETIKEIKPYFKGVEFTGTMFSTLNSNVITAGGSTVWDDDNDSRSVVFIEDGGIDNYDNTTDLITRCESVSGNEMTLADSVRGVISDGVIRWKRPLLIRIKNLSDNIYRDKEYGPFKCMPNESIYPRRTFNHDYRLTLQNFDVLREIFIFTKKTIQTD